MPEFIKILLVIFPYIVIGILIIFIIVVTIYLKVWDNSIVNLYMEGKYQESYEKIKLSKKMAFGIKKQWLHYYESLILISKNNYVDSKSLLLEIKSKKLESSKLFWLCFIEVKSRNIDKANSYYALLVQKSNVDHEIKLLRKMIDSIIEEDIIISTQELSKVKNPVILEYIREHFRLIN